MWGVVFWLGGSNLIYLVILYSLGDAVFEWTRFHPKSKQNATVSAGCSD